MFLNLHIVRVMRCVGCQYNVHSILQMSICNSTAMLVFHYIHCCKWWLTSSVSGFKHCHHSHCKSFNSWELTFWNKLWPLFHNVYFWILSFKMLLAQSLMFSCWSNPRLMLKKQFLSRMDYILCHPMGMFIHVDEFMF